MSPLITRLLIVVGALLVLGGVNYSIYGKERVIDSGQSIFLELAPVDPRSIMQGDYMTLRFQLAEQIAAIHAAREHRAEHKAPLQVASNGVATLDPTPDNSSVWIRYRVRQYQIWLGTNAYFFEEGSAARYQEARYGEFRVDPRSGEAVLVGLRDGDLRRL